ncbi:MAG: tryptophan--tRNA ligase [Cyanobium sp. MAG06]|nr:tryptophan--tRNA ligase [Cyanobium sp. MAG06]
MKKEKQILLSGVQSSGKLHFGNYFGALRQNIELANSGEYEAYIFIADYHALSTLKNGKEMNENIADVVATYIALGLDINKCAFFKQSDNIHHFELFTILNNYVTVPYIMRAHAFKDHEAKNKDINVGLLTYPILMAADILLYNADIVPVGADQKQHIEFARDIAGFFNRAHNTELFKLPKDYILPEVATLPGIDGNKMSKSKNNHLPIFASDEEIEKRVKKIITDSNPPTTAEE